VDGSWRRKEVFASVLSVDPELERVTPNLWVIKAECLALSNPELLAD
jgi:hypothetical protein